MRYSPILPIVEPTPPANDPAVEKLIRIFKEVCKIPNVYYEPPEKIKMVYPCIRFQRRRFESMRADNRPYIVTQSFDVTLIYREPDSPLPRRVASLPLMISHDRHYTADNLSHDAYIVYL